ncbi:MAG TPA: hypothetical protein VEB66_12775 [Opitutaceae bacterium]|nr:hypothetical protein [Opitutaceae bacterium]
MCLRFLPALLLVALCGCGRPPELADLVVRAGSDRELKAFRDEVGRRFPAAELANLDAALKEIRVEALERDISPADAREEYLRAAVHGRTVAEVLVRGWAARRARLEVERRYLDDLLRQDLGRQEKAPSESLAARIGAAREVLGRVERNLAETEAQLAAWARAGRGPGADAPSSGRR